MLDAAFKKKRQKNLKIYNKVFLVVLSVVIRYFLNLF